MRSAFTLGVLFLVACSGSSTVTFGESTAREDASAPAPGADNGEHEPSKPDGDPETKPEKTPVSIESFEILPAGLGEGEKATFRARIRGEVLRAVLTDEEGGQYGELVAQGPHWVAIRSWKDMHDVKAIEFVPPGASRTFVLTASGNGTATAKATLALRCDPKEEKGACGGKCTSFWSGDNCGGCGKACAAGGVCDRGKCREPGWSFCEQNPPFGATCAEYCQNQGKVCSNMCIGCAPGAPSCGMNGYSSCNTLTPRQSLGCADLLPAGPYRCCCIQ